MGCARCGAPSPVPGLGGALCGDCFDGYSAETDARYEDMRRWEQRTRLAVNAAGLVPLAVVRCAVCGGAPLAQAVSVEAVLYLRRREVHAFFGARGEPLPPSRWRALTGAGRLGSWCGWPLTVGCRYVDLFADVGPPLDEDVPHVLCPAHGRINWTDRDTATLRATRRDRATLTVRLNPTT